MKERLAMHVQNRTGNSKNYNHQLSTRMNQTKKITDLPAARIGDIVADNYHTAGVLKEFAIDFCCGGGILLEKACIKMNLNVNDVL